MTDNANSNTLAAVQIKLRCFLEENICNKFSTSAANSCFLHTGTLIIAKPKTMADYFDVSVDYLIGREN